MTVSKLWKNLCFKTGIVTIKKHKSILTLKSSTINSSNIFMKVTGPPMSTWINQCYFCIQKSFCSDSIGILTNWRNKLIIIKNKMSSFLDGFMSGETNFINMSSVLMKLSRVCLKDMTLNPPLSPSRKSWPKKAEMTRKVSYLLLLQNKRHLCSIQRLYMNLSRILKKLSGITTIFLLLLEEEV